MSHKHKQTLFKELAQTSNCTCSPQDLQPFGECICTIPKKRGNKVKQKIESLKASIETLDYKIKTLTPYFSQAQIRCWRKNRRNLNKKLKLFEGVLKMADKQVTASAILADIKQGQLSLLEQLKRQARKQEAQDFANSL